MSSPLKRAVRSHRWGLVFTYFLTVVENALELLYPFTVGLAIDGLLRGDGVMSIAPLAAAWVAHVATGAGRQLYDTRLFTAVYARAASAMIVDQRTQGVSTSEVAARVDMMEEVISFLEYELPRIAQSLIVVLGSIGMLFLYDVTAGLITAGLLIPVAVTQRLYGKRAFALNSRLNDRWELQVDAVADGKTERVKRALSRPGKVAREVVRCRGGRVVGHRSVLPRRRRLRASPYHRYRRRSSGGDFRGPRLRSRDRRIAWKCSGHRRTGGTSHRYFAARRKRRRRDGGG